MPGLTVIEAILEKAGKHHQRRLDDTRGGKGA